MATPLDPDRWNEFASPKPPPRHCSVQPPVAPESARTVVGELLDRLTVGALLSIVVQCGRASLDVVESASATGLGSRTIDAVDLRTVPIGLDGCVLWRASSVASSESLLDLLREGVGDQAIPPAVARLLLARPTPTLDRLVTQLQDLAVTSELVQQLPNDSTTPKSAVVSQPSDVHDVPGQIALSVGGVQDAGCSGSNDDSSQVGESPPATRRRRVDEDLASANDQHVSATQRIASIRDNVGFRRIAFTLGTGVLGLVVVLALLVGGGSASASNDSEAAQLPAVIDPSPPQGEDQADSIASRDVAAPMESAVAAPQAAKEVAPGVQSVVTPVSWAAVLAELDRSRQRFFESGDVLDLHSYAKPDSSVAVRDSTTQRELAVLGARAVGMKTTILGIEVLSPERQVTELLVSDELSGYQVVRMSTGDVIETRKARSAANWRVRLEQIGDRWVIVDAVAS